MHIRKQAEQKTNLKPKPIFILKDVDGKEQRYTTDEAGQLIPIVEVVEKKNPWQAVNTIAETCKILKISRNTVMSLISSGQLKAIKAGARYLITGQAIEGFLKISM